MPVSYEEALPGYEFPPTSYELSRSLVSQYLEATDSSDGDFVPPLAAAARAMAAMSELVTVPSGSIHASQEFEFFKLLPAGATVTCQTRVLRKLDRGKMHMLVLEMIIFDEKKEKVQSGKATVILPP